MNRAAHGATGANENSILSIGLFVKRRAGKLEWGGAECAASLQGPRGNGNRAGQPVADCLCFWGFRVSDAFMGAAEAEKRGGAGTISEMGDGDSGNRVAAGSIKLRATSVEDMGGDCRDLW